MKWSQRYHIFLSLLRNLKNIKDLSIAIKTESKVSKGSFDSSVDQFSLGGLERRDGKLEKIEVGKKYINIDLNGKNSKFWQVALAELSSVYYSTEIPNIKTYLSLQGLLGKTFNLSANPLIKLASNKLTNKSLKKVGGAFCFGPGKKLMNRNRSFVCAKANNGNKNIMASLEAPDAYLFTADLGVECATKIIEGELRGSLTPAQAFGCDYVLNFENVIRHEHMNYYC